MALFNNQSVLPSSTSILHTPYQTTTNLPNNLPDCSHRSSSSDSMIYSFTTSKSTSDNQHVYYLECRKCSHHPCRCNTLKEGNTSFENVYDSREFEQVEELESLQQQTSSDYSSSVTFNRSHTKATYQNEQDNICQQSITQHINHQQQHTHNHQFYHQQERHQISSSSQQAKQFPISNYQSNRSCIKLAASSQDNQSSYTNYTGKGEEWDHSQESTSVLRDYTGQRSSALCEQQISDTIDDDYVAAARTGFTHQQDGEHSQITYSNYLIGRSDLVEQKLSQNDEINDFNNNNTQEQQNTPFSTAQLNIQPIVYDSIKQEIEKSQFQEVSNHSQNTYKNLQQVHGSNFQQQTSNFDYSSQQTPNTSNTNSLSSFKASSSSPSILLGIGSTSTYEHINLQPHNQTIYDHSNNLVNENQLVYQDTNRQLPLGDQQQLLVMQQPDESPQQQQQINLSHPHQNHLRQPVHTNPHHFDLNSDDYSSYLSTTTTSQVSDYQTISEDVSKASRTISENNRSLKQSKGRRGRPRKKGVRSKNKVNGKLWEFIRDLLLNDRTNPSFIRWERREDGVFKFVQSDKVAKMWGERKQNPKMTYEKLSRAMRYYYKSKVLLPVFGRRLVYKFGPNATGWLPNEADLLY